MFKKLGAANTAKLEAAVSSREEADQAKFAQPSRSFYARQFDEAVSCRH